MLLFGVAYHGVRRAMIKDQRRPSPCNVPLWRLLQEEIALLARRVGRWKVSSVLAAAFICFLTVEVALSTSTPGPALAEVWRWLVASAMTALSLGLWAIGHAIRRTRTPSSSSV